MHFVLTIVQMIIACVLVGLILLQQKGTGLGAAFGGSSTIYSTRRGIDRLVFRMTIASAILFLGISIIITVL